MCASCCWRTWRFDRHPARTLLVFAAGMVGKLLFHRFAALERRRGILYGGDYSFLDAVMRLLDFGVVFGFLAFAFARLRGHRDARQAGIALGGTALAIAFMWSTLELHTVLHHFLPGMESGGISILWSLFAIGLILAGIFQNVRQLRYVGLGLFAVVAGKVFFVDLAQLEQLYRIIAFILLGVLVLCGSFIYLKFRQTFASSSRGEQRDRTMMRSCGAIVAIFLASVRPCCAAQPKISATPRIRRRRQRARRSSPWPSTATSSQPPTTAARTCALSMRPAARFPTSSPKRLRARRRTSANLVRAAASRLRARRRRPRDQRLWRTKLRPPPG